jgi:chromosomal replication initiator protein
LGINILLCIIQVSFKKTRGIIFTTMDIKKLWDDLLAQMEIEVSRANFSTWFKDTYINKMDGGVVYLAVPNTFAKEWLSQRYHKKILETLRVGDETIRSIEYIISTQKKKKDGEVGDEHSPNKELPLSGLFISPDDNLNPRYTFENFVVGQFNELAHAAAQAILKKPVAYNPLFYYGNTGLGKTHLMQAIGNHIKNHNKDRRVYYVTSEKFTMDYVMSLQSGKINNFKDKYRKYDVLIMDDIQFLSNKEKTQEELFHLFNYLYDNNKQIIFSSDVHVNHLPNLEDRLKSRFMAGMIIDISPADTESRMAILKIKARINSFNISDETASFLASNVNGSIRELEGVLNALMCQSQLKGRDLVLSEIKQLTKNTGKIHRNVSVKDVVRAVAAFYNIEEETIYNKTRRQEVVKPRQLTMYILREYYNISLPSIGQKLGGRDHTTVIHSCEKIKNEIKVNFELQSEINQIKAMI